MERISSCVAFSFMVASRSYRSVAIQAGPPAMRLLGMPHARLIIDRVVTLVSRYRPPGRGPPPPTSLSDVLRFSEATSKAGCGGCCAASVATNAVRQNVRAYRIAAPPTRPGRQFRGAKPSGSRVEPARLAPQPSCAPSDLPERLLLIERTAEELLDVFDGPQRQHARRDSPHLAGMGLDDDGARHLQRAGRHAELGEAAADEQPQQQRIGRHLAADRHRNAAADGAAADGTEQAQHRGMQRLIAVRYAIVGAIDGQRVLNEIVGADREEVDLTRQLRRGERR